MALVRQPGRWSLLLQQLASPTSPGYSWTTRTIQSPRTYPPLLWHLPANGISGIPVREPIKMEVLLSLSPKNYPKEIVNDISHYGPIPNTEEFNDATQNLLFVNAFRWVVSTTSKEILSKNRPLKQKTNLLILLVSFV